MVAARAALAGATIGALVFLATPAHAAEPNLTGDVPGGCLITFAIAPSANDFRPEVEQALQAIANQAQVTFSEVDEGADITYWQLDALGPRNDGGQAIGYWDQSARVVFLTDVRRSLRYPLVLHESMHAIGIGHADGPDNVSSELLTDRVKFGRQDRAALREVGRVLGCGRTDSAAVLAHSRPARPDAGLPSAHRP